MPHRFSGFVLAAGAAPPRINEAQPPPPPYRVTCLVCSPRRQAPFLRRTLVLLSYLLQKRAKVPPATMLPKQALFDIFVSDPELKGCSKLLDYLKGEDTMIDIEVPGCDPNERFLKPTNLARLLTLAILNWIIALHSGGWSLNGEISSHDVFLIIFGKAKMKEEEKNEAFEKV